MAMIIEINIVEGSKDWWVDFAAFRHVYYDKRTWFKNYNPYETTKEVMVGNSYTTKAMGEEKVELKFTSSHVFKFLNVFYLPQMKKNLVSSFILNKIGFKEVIELGNYVISKNGVFVVKVMLVVVCLS